MFRQKDRSEQKAFWTPTHQLPQASADSFYGRLDTQLTKLGFGQKVRELCEPFYDDSGRGHPGVDPEVFIRMQMVGFFESLPSDRAIARRCGDSIEIRAFLGYSLTDRTPDHSTICRFRLRIPEEVFRSMFELILKAMKRSNLLKGRNLGVDSSIIEANASLASLVNRMTEEDYAEYVRRLAAESGIDPEDESAVRRFDKNRKDRKTSNKEWKNPHDEDAKITRTKRGNTRMGYQPEHVVDLETGAIVDARIRPADEGDAKDLSSRIEEAEERLNAATDGDETTKIVSLTADKGYYSTDELTILNEKDILTNIPNKKQTRVLDKLPPNKRKAVVQAEACSTCGAGKAFARKRAELVERSFAHLLDAAGFRRTTLRGRPNVNKRYLIGALSYNLSLLMRKIYGVGTPKQAFALRVAALVAWFLTYLRRHGWFTGSWSASKQRQAEYQFRLTNIALPV